MCLLAASAVLFACSSEIPPSPDSAPGTVVRDSAGVRIVENARPSMGDSLHWRVGADPLFVIRSYDGGPENRLLDPTSIDVDSRGRIIVGDGNQVGWDAILVYDSLGRFQFQAGGEGEGPGEFGQLWWASSYRGDSLVAFDMVGDQTSIFGPDGEFSRLVRLPTLDHPSPPKGTFGFTAGVDAAYGDGHFLAYPFGVLNIGGGEGPAWYEHVLLRLDPEGEVADTLGTFSFSKAYWSGTEQEQLWLSPWAQSAVSDSKLYFGAGEDFEIRRYDSGGRLDLIVRRRSEDRLVTDEIRDIVLERYITRMRASPHISPGRLGQMERDLGQARFAEISPAFSGMLLDTEGYLWVQEFGSPSTAEGPASFTWSVFDSDGIWEGDLETPPGFVLKKVTATRLLGFVTNELDVTEIYVFTLDRSPRL